MNRRGWMARAAAALGAAMTASVIAPAAAFLERSSRIRRRAEKRIDLCAVTELAADGPTRFAVEESEHVDAYAKGAGGVLGAVWLSQAGGSVRALSTRCPHAACGVDWDQKARVYQCPCHDSAFSPTGDRLSGPAPSGLSPVNAEVRDGRVWITWKK